VLNTSSPIASFLAALILTAALSACSDADTGSSRTAPTMPASPASEAEPSPVPPTPTPARPASAIVGGQSSLWVGPPPTRTDIWAVCVITPGADPERDPWRFEGGIAGPARSCTPRRDEFGLHFDDCAPLIPGVEFTALLGEDGEAPSIRVRTRDGETVLTRPWQRDEGSASANVEVLWQHEGETPGQGDLWVDGGVVYASARSGHVEMLDAVSGVLLGSLDTRVGEQARATPWILDLKVHDGILYLATVARGVLLFDVRDPQQPRFLGQYYVPYGGNDVAFANVHNIFLAPGRSLLFAINHSYQKTDLRVIDVSDPTAPHEAGRFQVPVGKDIFEGVHDVFVIERDGRLLAFLKAMLSGLYVLDVTDPSAIEVVSSITWDRVFSHSGWPFVVDGRLYYAHNDEGVDQGMTVLDLSDLRQPRIVSHFQTRRGTSPHEVQVVDGIAYLAYYIDGLRVVDLRDPARPREIAHFDTVPAAQERDVLQGAWGLQVVDDRVYLADFDRGIYSFAVDIPD
jgi:choice-of-anchor B domain-containing protein